MGKLGECRSCVTVLITTLSPQHEAPTFMYTEFDYNLLEYLCIKFQAAGTLIRMLMAYYLSDFKWKEKDAKLINDCAIINDPDNL